MRPFRSIPAALIVSLLAAPLAAQESHASAVEAVFGAAGSEAGTSLFPSRIVPPPSLGDAAPSQAIDHSDAYYKRLTIHRIGSYAMLPLFAGEYLLGNELLNADNPADWVKPTHGAVAGALGAVFVVNTVTGVWNLIESKDDPGAARRWLHSALMLGADAAMVYTAALAGDADEGEEEGTTAGNAHRNWALVSMSGATAGTLLMWLWPD